MMGYDGMNIWQHMSLVFNRLADEHTPKQSSADLGGTPLPAQPGGGPNSRAAMDASKLAAQGNSAGNTMLAGAQNPDAAPVQVEKKTLIGR